MLDKDNKFYQLDKIIKGDIGEFFCEYYLNSIGYKAENLNFPKKNRKGIDLKFTNNSFKNSFSNIGCVQCRGGIRNPYNCNQNRPENDRAKIPENKVFNAQEASRELDANLYWSVAFIYGIDDETSLIFFFFCSDEFMRNNFKTKKNAYSFQTKKLWNLLKRDISEGLVFKIYKFNTQEILKLTNETEISEFKEIFNKIQFNNIKNWNEFNEVDLLND